LARHVVADVEGRLIGVAGEGVANSGILENIPKVGSAGYDAGGRCLAAQNRGAGGGHRGIAAILLNQFQIGFHDRGSGRRSALHRDGIRAGTAHEPVLGVATAIED